MSLIKYQKLTKSGQLTPITASANGDKFANGAGIFVQVRNVSDEVRTITVPATVSFIDVPGAGELPIADLSFTLSPNSDQLFNVPTTHTLKGISHLNYSNDLGVLVSVIKLDQ